MSELLLLAAIAQAEFGKRNPVKGFSPCWVSLHSYTIDHSEVSFFISVTESGLSFIQMLLCIWNSSALIQFPQLPKCSLCSCMWSQVTFHLPCFLKDFRYTLHFLSDFFCFRLQTLCLIKFSFLLNVFEYLLKYTLHFLSDFFCFRLQTLCLIKFSFLLNVFEYLLKDISLLQCVFSRSANTFLIFDNLAQVSHVQENNSIL